MSKTSNCETCGVEVAVAGNYKKYCEGCLRERRRASIRRWRSRNLEHARAMSRKYAASNREKLREYARQYRIDNKEKVQAYHRAYKARNRERLREYNRERARKKKETLNGQGALEESAASQQVSAEGVWGQFGCGGSRTSG